VSDPRGAHRAERSGRDAVLKRLARIARWCAPILACAIAQSGSGLFRAASAFPIDPPGRHLAAALDRMKVEQRWQPGEPVNWRTGMRDPGGKRLTGHCSAFVAAVCAVCGIYILRPPQHGEQLLANAQCEWLRTDGTRQGWKRVASGLTAQRLANRGHLVLACYRNPDRDGPGHIAVVRPSTKGRRRIEAEGPDVTQAGARNFRRTSARNGFRLHLASRDLTGIIYYSHAVPPSRPR
jgi:hypothetical protein